MDVCLMSLWTSFLLLEYREKESSYALKEKTEAGGRVAIRDIYTALGLRGG